MNDMTPEQMAALIEADRERRRQATAQGIEAILQANRCQLRALPQITPDGRITAAIVIDAL